MSDINIATQLLLQFANCIFQFEFTNKLNQRNTINRWNLIPSKFRQSYDDFLYVNIVAIKLQANSENFCSYHRYRVVLRLRYRCIELIRLAKSVNAFLRI